MWTKIKSPQKSTKVHMKKNLGCYRIPWGRVWNDPKVLKKIHVFCCMF